MATTTSPFAAVPSSSPFAAAPPSSPVATNADPQATTIPDDAEDIDDDFLIAREPNAFARLLSTIRGSRRNMAIAAGAAGLLVIVSALAFCGGGSSGKSKQSAASERVHAGSANSAKGAREPEVAPDPVETAKPAVVAVAPAPVGSGVGSAETPEPTGPTPEELAAAAEPEPAATNTDAATQTKRDTGKATSGKSTTGTTAVNTGTATTGGGKKLGGKQVILEYDTQARETKPAASAPKSDQAAIQKARSAYASGNQRLFAGDAAGAIKFYRQSLGFYPGYVAGYRGLGLAYAQQHDNSKALQALRTYVSSVPTAKDAALIRKRISSLSGK